ncbi:MAG: phosphotyrosine protein phosphatase [Leptospirales bacterium]|nr:phosphotyrosine protein phosphatase [Leptospirales bacterium]
MLNLLFVCSQNKLRSPTAEEVYSDTPGVETRSAGLNSNSQSPISLDDVEWADLIFVMEQTHRIKLQKAFGKSVGKKRIVVLNIPDQYDYMQPELIESIREKVDPVLARYR